MSANWDEMYLENEMPWDKGAPSPPLVKWLEDHPAGIRGRVLVPGCGLGHDVRAIACGEGIEEVVGLDISPTAVAKAREWPPVGPERYENGDLFRLDSRHADAYDWIWEHTCYCAIPPERRDDYVEAVFHALKSGGSFLGVFYLDPYDGDHQPGGGPPHGSERSELVARFCDSGMFTITGEQIPELSYPGREGRELLIEMRKAESLKPET